MLMCQNANHTCISLKKGKEPSAACETRISLNHGEGTKPYSDTLWPCDLGFWPYDYKSIVRTPMTNWCQLLCYILWP